MDCKTTKEDLMLGCGGTLCTPVLKRQRQEDHKFKVRLCCIVRFCLKTDTEKERERIFNKCVHSGTKLES
jgi:hypothetical protein